MGFRNYPGFDLVYDIAALRAFKKSSLERFQWYRMKLARHKPSKMATMLFLVKVVELVDRGRNEGDSVWGSAVNFRAKRALLC